MQSDVSQRSGFTSLSRFTSLSLQRSGFTRLSLQRSGFTSLILIRLENNDKCLFTIVSIPLIFFRAPQQPRKDTRIQTMAVMMSSHGNDKCTQSRMMVRMPNNGGSLLFFMQPPYPKRAHPLSLNKKINRSVSTIIYPLCYMQFSIRGQLFPVQPFLSTRYNQFLTMTSLVRMQLLHLKQSVIKFKLETLHNHNPFFALCDN